MKRVEIFLCVDKASVDPDHVGGLVPFRVSDEFLFFGPDQTPLRAEFRKRFFTHTDDVKPDADLCLYLVGVNDLSKPDAIRKIIWVGKIVNIMSFAVAGRLLDDPRFAVLDDVRLESEPEMNMSPLHIEAIDLMGKLGGYRHRSDYHAKVGKDGIPEWVKDVADPRDKREFGVAGKEFLLRDVTRARKVLKRDCCFLCENIFFAQGEGMPIGDRLVSLLAEAQPGQGVDGVAVFGYSQGKDGQRTMNKLKGPALHIRWRIADGILDQLLRSIPGE